MCQVDFQDLIFLIQIQEAGTFFADPWSELDSEEDELCEESEIERERLRLFGPDSSLEAILSRRPLITGGGASSSSDETAI